MSTATINIPHEHRRAVRDSLEARRHEIERDGDLGRRPEHLEEIDAVLQQIDASASDAAQAVTGSYRVLWTATYDALCLAAERFAADCNELWRGGLEVQRLRSGLDALGERIDLLETLGVSPERRQ
jgi:hypothetical protein